LTVAADVAENEGGHLRIFVLILQAPAGTPAGHCQAATATLSPSSPIVMDPPRGKDECIAFGIEADTGSSSGQVHVSATGFVASGSYAGPHGNG
jgi:hypothetical protein